MTRRAGFWLACVFVIIGCVEVAGCNGTPSNYNQVLLSATATTVGPSQTVTVTATVPGDKTNAGVTWTFTPGAGAPTPPGTFSSTTTTATYTSPATVTAQFTVTIQATSIAFPSETKSVTLTVTPPQPLGVQTTSLPNGVQGTPYPGAQLQASGGIGPYTWQVTGGTVPPGITISSTGAVSNDPNLHYPTTAGNYSFTVQVTDSETPAVSATGTVTMTVTNLLNGSYAFEFSGSNSGGRVVMAGSFTTDGVSTITGGVEDVNSISGTPKTQTFTGTYTLGNDYRGQLAFSSLPGSPTYYFSIDTTGVHGRMIEFDSTGVSGSGQFAQQTTTACAYNTLSGSGTAGNNFVIGLTGAEASIGGSAGPFALAGRFTAEVPANSTTPGTLDNGEVDANAPGSQLITQGTLSGTFAATSQPGRCTMSVAMTLSNMNFAVYPISSSNGLLTQAYVVETDTLSATTPFVSVGRLIQQPGYPFSNTYLLFSKASVGGLSGALIPTGQSSYVPFAGVVQMQPTGGTAVTLSLVDNVAGTVRTDLGTNAISTNFGAGDSYGRVDTTLVDTDPLVPLDPVFYVIGPNEALCLLKNQNAAVLGIFEPQSMGTGNTSFSAATITNVFAQSTALPAVSTTPNMSGAVALVNSNATTGTVAGIQDFDVTSGQDLTETGNYTLTSSGATDGSATMNLTAPSTFTGSFFIVSPTKAVMVSTTSGDTNPVLIILGDQIDDFGVN